MKIYEPYSWLWLNDKQEYLDNFLRFAKHLTEEERDILAQSPPNLSEYLKEKNPELADFKLEIDYFMELYKKCDQIENEKIFYRWFKINNKLFKQTLLNIVCKWANVLKTHLIDQVNSRFKFIIIIIITIICYHIKNKIKLNELYLLQFTTISRFFAWSS